MRFFWTLLLAFAFCHTALAAVLPPHGCCESPECEMVQCDTVQCAQIGCLPAAQPLAAVNVSLISPATPALDYAPVAATSIHAVLHEIWTPPD